jgi:hypothetical protein
MSNRGTAAATPPGTLTTAEIAQKIQIFKVDELKDVLGDLCLSKSGRKAMLQDRIVAFYEANPLARHTVIATIEKTSRSRFEVFDLTARMNTPYHRPIVPQLSRPMPMQPFMNTPIPNSSRTVASFPLNDRPVIVSNYAHPSSVKMPATNVSVATEKTVLYEELNTVASYTVGIGGQKPPLGIRLSLSEADFAKLDAIDPISNTKQHRLFLFSVQIQPIPPVPGKIIFPSGCSVTFNNQYVQVISVLLIIVESTESCHFSAIRSDQICSNTR